MISEKPRIAIGHFLKRLEPIQPYKRMPDVIRWRKDEKFGNKNFDRFVREVAVQARKMQSEC